MKAVVFDFNRTLYDPYKQSLFPETLNLLKRLEKSLKLFLIVKGKEDRKDLIKNLDIEKYFDEIILDGEKDLSDFKRIARMFEPKETLVVGDRVKKEIKFGNICNMTTIWFRNGKFRDETPSEPIEKPDYVITSLNEILDLI